MKNHNINVLFSVSIISFLASYLFSIFSKAQPTYFYIVSNCTVIQMSYITVIVGFGLIIGLFYFQSRKILDSFLLSTGYGLILGGGCFQLLVKIISGCVSDYFDFFGLFYFNFPDVLISVGILTFLYTLYIKEPLPRNHK